MTEPASQLNFTPIEGAKYSFDYQKICADINRLVDSEPRKFLQFMRFWCREDLFFLLYFILKVPVNHPWLIERIKDVHGCNDRTLDLWSREHFKALSIDEKVLTINGWKCHGDLQPGDKIFGSAGQIITVVANTGPMYNAQCYEVEFDDNILVAAGDHLWPVLQKSKPRISGTDRRYVKFKHLIKRTDELSPKLDNIPRTPILDGTYQLLPIDPYVLGVWLGDGETNGGRITSADEEIIDSIRMAGFKISKGSDKYGYGIYDLRTILKEHGLFGNKHIPWRYLISLPKDRLALLQGLMDTDGSCNDRGTAYFVNTNHNIASGVYFLAASLGMKPHINMYDSQNTGEYKPTYGVTFQAYDNLPPFRLHRKLSNCKKGTFYNPNRYIKSVNKVDSVPVNCIQVDADDGIYLSGISLIPTHNSTIITYGLNIQEILCNPNTSIGIFSHTRTIARSFLRRIKLTLETNDLLKGLFPDILYEKPETQSPKWSEDEGILVKRSVVLQEMTVESWGLVDGMPTSKHFAVLNYDDVVTKESVNTPDQLKKIDDCFKLSLNLGTSDGKKRVIGTIYHFNDQYIKMQQQMDVEGNPMWVVRKHPCYDESGNPVLLTKEQLEEKKIDQGPYVFATQMLLNPIADESRTFNPSWVKYWRVLPEPLNKYILCDPASKKKRDSDYTVMAVIGLDALDNYYLVDFLRKRLNLRERWLHLKELVQVHPTMLGVFYEEYALQADIEYFEEVKRREGISFLIDKVAGPQSKNSRIERLQPRFAAGKFLIPYSLQVDGEDMTKTFLEEEYQSYPYCPHKDMLDCISRVFDINPIRPQFFPEDRTESRYNKKPAKHGTWMAA